MAALGAGVTRAEFRAKVTAKLNQISRTDSVAVVVALVRYGRRLVSEGAGANVGEGVRPDGEMGLRRP
jgi:hypothetical protein